MEHDTRRKKINRLLTVCGAALLLLFCLISFWSFTAGSLSYTSKLNNIQLGEIAAQTAGTVKIELEKSLDSVQSAAKAMAYFDDIHSSEALKCLGEMAESSDFNWMRTTSPNGDSWRTKDERVDIAQRDYFQKAMAGESGISNLMESVYNGKTIFVAYAPIYHGGKVVGTLHGVYEVDRLEKITGLTSFDGQGYAHIFQKDGAFVLSSIHMESLNGTSDNIWSFFQQVEYTKNNSYESFFQAVQNDESGSISYDQGEARRMAYYRPVGINDWYILQVVPQTVIEQQTAPINQRALVLMLQVLVVFLLGAGGFVFYRRMSRKEIVEADRQLMFSTERFKIAISHTTNIIFEFDPAANSITFISDISKVFGFPQFIENGPEYLIQKGFVDLSYRREFKTLFEKMQQGAPEALCTAKFWPKNGKYAWYKISITNLLENGKPVRAIGTVEDITEVKKTELRYEKEKQYRVAMLSDALLIYEINVTKDKVQAGIQPDTKVAALEWDPYADSMRKYAEQSVCTEDKKKFLQNSDKNSLLSAFQSGTSQVYFEYRRSDLSNEPRWVSSTTNLVKDPATGDVKGFTYVRDINERKCRELALQYRAERDVLTGLYNRTTASSFITRFLQSAVQHVGMHGFMIMDLDGFKLINDKYGHILGDELLKEVAAKMNMIFRASDVVARLGGDEFIVFLKDAHSEEHIQAKADELCAALRGLPVNGEHLQCISASIGIAMVPRHGLSFELLYQKSDAALYAAKRAGKNRYAVYDDSMYGSGSEHNN